MEHQQPSKEKRARSDDELSAATQHRKSPKTYAEDSPGLPAPSLKLDFCEPSRLCHTIPQSSLTIPESADDELASRVKEAVDSASGKPFAKENLCKARRWLHFHGLVVCEIAAESKSTPAQQSTPPALIHCVGHWQGINSFIKGHSRRGMKRIRAQHRVYGHVAIMNEYNSSKTCPFCFSKVILHHVCRIVGKNERVVRLHGAIECVHPQCPARRINYTTRGRDANAAANIALSGASVILSSDCQPLPPFRRNANQTRYNLAQELTVAKPETGSLQLHS